tara:strand:- start:378 stop:683 length:306 start_codon:yes stop_codon:yes gene_type:complete
MNATDAPSQKPLSRIEQKQAAIRAKLAAKFGDKVLPEKKADKVEITSKAEKRLEKGDENFADIASNDPNKEETRAKLMGLMKSGGFQFSDKERAALSEILE